MYSAPKDSGDGRNRLPDHPPGMLPGRFLRSRPPGPPRLPSAKRPSTPDSCSLGDLARISLALFGLRRRPLAGRGGAVAPLRQGLAATLDGALELGDHRPALAGPGRQRRGHDAAELVVLGTPGIQHLHIHDMVALLDPVAPLVVIGGVGGGILAKEKNGVVIMLNLGV